MQQQLRGQRSETRWRCRGVVERPYLTHPSITGIVMDLPKNGVICIMPWLMAQMGKKLQESRYILVGCLFSPTIMFGIVFW